MYRHIYASKSNLAPYDRRKRMCELAFGAGDEAAAGVGAAAAAAGASGAGGVDNTGNTGTGAVFVLDAEREVDPGIHRPPRHHHALQPSILEFNGIL